MLEVADAYGLTFLVPRQDSAVGACLRDYGEFARPEVDLICDYLAPQQTPATFIDVGANVGAIALPVAARYPDWRVLAFEAHRGLAGVLAANVYGNRLFKVEPIHAAVGAAAGLAMFPSAPLSASGNFGALSFEMAQKTPTEEVRVCTLADTAPADVRVVKIDVEGFELPVLAGAGRLIDSRAVVWLIEAAKERRSKAMAIAALMRQAGYRLFWFYAPFVCPTPQRGGKPATQHGDLNFLALPPGAANLWDLEEVSARDDAAWPDHVRQFRYLLRYGYEA